MRLRVLGRVLLRLVVAVPGSVCLGAVACVVRFRHQRSRPRIVLGVTPIISLSLIARALRQAGYEATTLVHQPYAINRRSDFDRVIADLPLVGWLRRLGLTPLGTALAPYVAMAWTLRHAEVLVCFFDGGPLAGSAIERWEPALLHLAGCRIVVMPYGSDSFIAARVGNTAWRDSILLSYPQLGTTEARIARRVHLWCAQADHVVACLIHHETLDRYDTLTTHYYPIDTARWTPAPHHPERDGVANEVVVGHSPNHRAIKGTDALITAIDQLRAEGLRIRLELLERLPNDEVRVRLAQCDILVEQLHLGYALSAMEGMALARPVISNLEDARYYDVHRQLTGLDECPIVSATPATVADALRRLTTDPDLRQRLGDAGRRYIERHHSIPAMARLWDLLIRSVTGDASVPRAALRVWHPDFDPAGGAA